MPKISKIGIEGYVICFLLRNPLTVVLCINRQLVKQKRTKIYKFWRFSLVLHKVKRTPTIRTIAVDIVQTCFQIMFISTLFYALFVYI
jgi:hypothetical protein